MPKEGGVNINPPKEIQDLMLKHYPEYLIETFNVRSKYYICSLRHKTLPQGSATGGACYLIDKKTNKIEVCGITDSRVLAK